MRIWVGMVMLCAFVVAVAPNALADWPHDVKWDQLEPISSSFAWAHEGAGVSADDFLCGETGWLTDIEFLGDIYNQINEGSTIQITFWADVPASPEDESHPGAVLWGAEVGIADASGIGWQIIEDYDPVVTEQKFKINLPEDLWFEQQVDTIYWISIESAQAGFTWMVLDEGFGWNDDAVFMATNNPDVWEHYGWNEDGQLDRYKDLLPCGWTSADLSFRLTGIPIPEPSLVVLFAVAGVAILKRRSR